MPSPRLGAGGSCVNFFQALGDADVKEVACLINIQIHRSIPASSSLLRPAACLLKMPVVL